MTFKLERSTLALLRASVPRGQMTRFVEEALWRALEALPAAERALDGKRAAHLLQNLLSGNAWHRGVVSGFSTLAALDAQYNELQGLRNETAQALAKETLLQRERDEKERAEKLSHGPQDAPGARQARFDPQTDSPTAAE